MFGSASVDPRDCTGNPGWGFWAYMNDCSSGCGPNCPDGQIPASVTNPVCVPDTTFARGGCPVTHIPVCGGAGCHGAPQLEPWLYIAGAGALIGLYFLLKPARA